MELFIPSSVILSKEIKMKKTISVILTLVFLTITACAPQTNPSLPTQPPAVTVIAAGTQTPSVVSTTDKDPSLIWKQYNNADFGLSFQYPSQWFGPEEYIAESVLRVEIGSDRVYPYGTDPAERVYDTINSYSIVIQYSQNDQNTYGTDIYQILESLQDGESFSDPRVTITRVSQLTIGNFTGYEYIATLSETAQTERFYSREIILVDDRSDVLTVYGTPINVEIGDSTDWRVIYQTIDEENLAFFQQIIDSITIE